MEGEPAIADSARRHAIADEDILHAFRNPVASEDLDEGFTMLIGPDPAGNLLEIGVVEADDGVLIVHAMRARPQYTR